MAVANTFSSLKPMYKETYAKKTAEEKPFNKPKEFKFKKIFKAIQKDHK
jgi:hypothetical protein